MKIYYGSFSECGPRKNNEDYIAVREMPERESSIFVLCDGMGGHHCGEVASRLVAERICDYWVRNPQSKDLRNKVTDACSEVMSAFNDASRVAMGTTMAMVAIEGRGAVLAHCGDSRIYVVRDHEIIFRTVDHVTLMPEGWPIIHRAFFTGSADYQPDIEEMEIRIGDMILICSDGVFGNGKWMKVHDVLADKDTSPCLLSDIEKIASYNAHDNYSAVLIRVCED